MLLGEKCKMIYPRYELSDFKEVETKGSRLVFYAIFYPKPFLF